MVDAVVVPVTTSEPFTVVISDIESPNVALPSTVNVDAVVVESVTDPTDVRLFTNTSPSASTRNFTEPPTAAAKRFVSPAAVAGFMTKDASNGFAPEAPIVQDPNVWDRVGTRVPRMPPAKVDVAVVDVAENDGADTSP